MGRPPQAPPLEIYLTGGEYTFGYPGNSTTPQFPPIRSRVIIHGGGATVRFQPEAGALIPDWLHIGEGAELSLHHLTLAGSDGRLILNRGVLHLADVRLTNDSGGPDYTLPDGGGITNYGTLTLTRTRLDHNRILTATTPGGAIWNAGSLTATCATFADSRASKGGAVWNAAGGQAAFTKVKFAGNVANGGGAVFNADAAHIVQITDGWWGGATPVFNDATQGTDTLGGLVSYTAAASDPLAAPDCQSPPPEPPPSGNTSLFSAASVPDGSSVQLPASIPPGGVARGKIAFMSNRNGNNDIYVMDTNGANVVQVTNTANEREYAPVWSPDGQKLVYKSSFDNGNARWTIITPGTSSQPIWIAENDSWFPTVRASWFPNGQYLAMPLYGDLYQVQSDGQNLTKILDNDLPILRGSSDATWIRSVAWSPTGTHIAFVTYSDYTHSTPPSSQPYRLYVADINTSPDMPPSLDQNSIRLITDIWPVFEPFAPVWSPNGQELALWMPDLVAFNVTSLQTRTLLYNPFYIPSGGQVRIYGWNWSRYDQTAFSVPDPTTYRRWIHLADPVGGALSQNGNTHSYSDYYPDFSPDACFGYESGGVCRIGQQRLSRVCSTDFSSENRVNIRSGPSTQASVVRTIPPTANIGFLGQYSQGTDTWYCVEYDSAKLGWMSSSLFVRTCESPLPMVDSTCTLIPPAATPTPPVLPPDTEALILALRTQYGVYLEDAPFNYWRDPTYSTRSSLPSRVRAVYNVVQYLDQAIFTESPEEGKDFKAIFGPRTVFRYDGTSQPGNPAAETQPVMRNENVILVFNLTGATGKTFDACGSKITQDAGPLDLTRCTVTHELGHVLFARAAYGSTGFAQQYREQFTGSASCGGIPRWDPGETGWTWRDHPIVMTNDGRTYLEWLCATEASSVVREFEADMFMGYALKLFNLSGSDPLQISRYNWVEKQLRSLIDDAKKFTIK